jgi:ketol-acid reductoisomerase
MITLVTQADQHPIEDVGRQLRGLMSWVNAASDDDYVEGTAAR